MAQRQLPAALSTVSPSPPPAESRTRTASTLNVSTLGRMTELSEQDRAILALEASLPGRGGEKEQRARDELGLSATAYYQRLNALLDRVEALAEYPVLVHRLRRIRSRRKS